MHQESSSVGTQVSCTVGVFVRPTTTDPAGCLAPYDAATAYFTSRFKSLGEQQHFIKTQWALSKEQCAKQKSLISRRRPQPDITLQITPDAQPFPEFRANIEYQTPPHPVQFPLRILVLSRFRSCRAPLTSSSIDFSSRFSIVLSPLLR